MTEVTHGSTNVYADLGFEDADEMFVKAQLVTKINQIISQRRWTKQRASEVMGLPRPKLSKMLKGHFRGISLAKLLDCLVRLGRDVQIVVGPERDSAEAGRVNVVFVA